MVNCFAKAQKRETGLKTKVGAKLAGYNQEIQAIQDKVT
jgi:hypothetical protein